MKAIRKPAAQPGFEYAEVPKPGFGPDEVLIKVAYASICGTDLHITEWDEWSASRIKPPMTYGHEFCGFVEAVGGQVSHLQPGDYVSAEMHIPCETCYHCMTGQRHICENVRIAGIDLDGCYAEYVTLPAKQVIKLPPAMPVEYGACLDSLGNAVHAVSRAEVSGKTVLITGCGPVGLFSIAVCKALGATRVFASDVSDYRIEMAKHAGATEVLDPRETDIASALQARTEHRGVDVVLEMSGNPQAIRTGLTALSPGGLLVLFGIPHGPVELDITNGIIFKEARVIGIHGREMYQTWLLMLDLLHTGRLDIDWMITHRFPLSEFGKAIDLVRSGRCGKILLQP